MLRTLALSAMLLVGMASASAAGDRKECLVQTDTPVGSLADWCADGDVVVIKHKNDVAYDILEVAGLVCDFDHQIVVHASPGTPSQSMVTCIFTGTVLDVTERPR